MVTFTSIQYIFTQLSFLSRNYSNAVVSQFALADTYFPAFKQSVMEGKAAGVM